jgi:hypothetical protein
MNERARVIGFVLWAAVGCGEGTEDVDEAVAVSGALVAAAPARAGQAFELLAAGSDGTVALFKGEVVGVEPSVHCDGDRGLLLRASSRTEMSGTWLRADRAIEIAGAGDRFDGKYLVTGTSHRFGITRTRAEGARFSLPEVDDEVLVAFAGGDPRRPVILGAIWNPEDAPEERTCRR